MSFNGIYACDRYYPQFKPGDEIFTEKNNWKAITSNRPYTVIKCEKMQGLTIDIYLVTLNSDYGYESSYASYQFKKTERQIREDKINSIL